MLREVDVRRIPKGSFNNSMLRAIFGKKHGTPVMERFTTESGIKFDRQVTGNRRLARLRRRNPLPPIVHRDVKDRLRQRILSMKEKVWTKLLRYWFRFIGFFSGGSSGPSPS